MRILKKLSIFILLTSCMFNLKPYAYYKFELNKEYSVNVGKVMLEWEQGLKSDVVENAIIKNLLYGGINNNVIKIIYREYAYDPEISLFKLIREAYSINLEYDLNLSNIISFRDIQIQILKADNNEITFKVLKAPESKTIQPEYKKRTKRTKMPR